SGSFAPTVISDMTCLLARCACCPASYRLCRVTFQRGRNMRVVIVGAGQAGAALAAKLRSLGADGPITMIGDEAAPPYQRPPLSKAYLMGEMEQERLWLRGPEFWDENNITLRLGAPVTAIDRAAKTVTTGAETIPYDQLALTTGSSPRRLPAAMGGDLEGVFTLRNLRD